MANKKLQKAGVLWRGTLKDGKGLISTESKALFEQPYSFELVLKTSQERTPRN